MNSNGVVASNHSDTYFKYGNRLGEILSEKGNAFTVPAFSKRVGISESTLYRMIKGQRPIKPSELDIISEGLGIKVERFKQQDTQHLFTEMSNLVNKRSNLHRAMDIAQKLEHLSLGCTERFSVLNNLGTIHHFLGNNHEAHEIWLKALSCAQKMKQLYSDHESLSKITSNLIISYTQLGEFMSLSRFLNSIEDDFETYDPEYAGTLYYSHAMAARNSGDQQTFREKMYKSLESFHVAGVQRSIGRAEHSVADAEYQLGNYLVAKQMFECAIKTLAPYEDLVFISKKDYAKTLLKLKETSRAVRLIEESIVALSCREMPDLLAKFLLLHGKIKNDMESAKRVLEIHNVSESILLLAYQFLMDHYSEKGDASALMEYYKSAKLYCNSPSLQWEAI